jgi:hypothetical protein
MGAPEGGRHAGGIRERLCPVFQEKIGGLLGQNRRYHLRAAFLFLPCHSPSAQRSATIFVALPIKLL